MAWWVPLAIMAGSYLANKNSGDDGGYKAHIAKPSAEETKLLQMLMALMENPYKTWDEALNAYELGEVDPSTPFGAVMNFYVQLDEARKIYGELPEEYAWREKLYSDELDTIAKNLGVEKRDLRNTLGFLSAETKDVQGKMASAVKLFDKSLAALPEEAKVKEKIFGKATDVYKEQIGEISKTPGVPVSFGGQPMGELLPQKQMALKADLAGKQYGAEDLRYQNAMQNIAARQGMAESRLGGTMGGYEDILGAIGQRGSLATTGYGAEESYANLLNQMATEKYGAGLETLGAKKDYANFLSDAALKQYGIMSGWQMDPMMNMWKTMYSGRFGTSSEYEPSWMDRILPLLATYYGAQSGSS